MSREEMPKQALTLVGERSMFQHSVDRILPLFPIERILVVTRVEYKMLIPGNQMTITAQTIINAENRPVSCIRKAIEPFVRSKLDYIIFDTAPSVGGIQERAIWAADLVIIPSVTDYLSTDGVTVPECWDLSFLVLDGSCFRIRQHHPAGKGLRSKPSWCQYG